MPFSSAGFTQETFEEILAAVQQEARNRIASNIDTDVNSATGQIWNIIALFDERQQQIAAAIHAAFDPRLAEGAQLDLRLGSIGVLRLPADQAEVMAIASGPAATPIPDGTEFEIGGFRFLSINGPYVIAGGGTAMIRVRSVLAQQIDVSGLGAWTIISVTPLTGLTTDSQPNLGRSVELDAAYRGRAETVRFTRSSRNLLAIDARLLGVDQDGNANVPGLTFARSFENVTVDPTDADGIPYLAINVITRGGDAQTIAEQIIAAGPAATRYYGTDETNVVGGGSRQITVGHDRVADVLIYVRVTVTTSTAEDPTPSSQILGLIETALTSYFDGSTNIDVGTDVVAVALETAIVNGGIVADGVDVTLSLDDLVYVDTKLEMSIRQLAQYDNARLAITEN